MQQNVLIVSGLSSTTNVGLLRSMRMVTDMGHLPFPVLTAIETGKDKKDPASRFIIPEETVLAQLLATTQGRIFNAVQIGCFGTIETQKKTCAYLQDHKVKRMIPVVANPCLPIEEQDESALAEAVQAFIQNVCPLANLITPSIREAEALTGQPIHNAESALKAAETLLTFGCSTVFLRNGEFQENQTTHYLVTESAQLTFSAPRLLRKSPDRRSGFGSAFASAIAIGLAKGQNYESCIERALVQVKRMSLSEL